MSASIAVDTGTSPFVSEDRLNRGALVGAAGLIGFGLILFIAANWDALTRFQRFGLAATVVAAGGLAALVRESLRVPGLLLATAAAGGLFALIGQTYQTGADTWQLFALWAALTLPWAVGAQSDAVWTPWALITATAIALWHQTSGFSELDWFNPVRAGDRSGTIAGVPFPVLAAWGWFLALSAAMGLWTGAERWLGSRRWAFRVAVALTLLLVTSHVVSFVLVGSEARVAPYLVGLMLIAAIAAWLVLAREHDVLLIAVAAFAIDIALIAGFTRLVTPSTYRSEFGTFFVVGIGAATIVAASVVAVLRLLRDRGSGEAEAMATRAVDAHRPWPVVILSGIGALIAAVPFIAAIGVLLGRALSKGPATYVIAAVLIPLAAMAMRKARSLFVEQLAMVGLATGLLLLGWCVFRDLSMGVAGVIMGLVGIGMALALGRVWIAALLGAAATVGFALAIDSLLPAKFLMPGAAQYALVWSVLGLAGFLAAIGLGGGSGWLQPLGSNAFGEETVEATVSGWLGAALAGLALGSGATFLIGAHVGGMAGVNAAGEPTGLILLGRVISLALAAGGALWLGRVVPSLRSPMALAVMATVVALSWAMPSLGAVALMLALSIVTRRRVIGVAAAAAALWIAGAFYYNLAMPLTYKAAILTATGALLGSIALALGARLERSQGAGIKVAGAGWFAIPAVLTIVGLVAVGGVALDAIRSKEALIRDGAPIYVELVPVDPRSLMQGDYMALRFRLPDGDVRRPWPAGTRPVGLGKRDPRGVLTITRVAEVAAPLADGETRIALRRSNRGQWIVVTDAWYFKEGTAQRWTAARYGEFRVLPDGSALLVGLSDKDLVAIK